MGRPPSGAEPGAKPGSCSDTSRHAPPCALRVEAGPGTLAREGEKGPWLASMCHWSGRPAGPPRIRTCATGASGLVFGGDDRVSQVPGGPPCVHALLFDPGGISAPGQRGASVWPSVVLKTSAPTVRSCRGSMTRPARSLSTPRRAGYPTPRKTRFRGVVSPSRAGVITRWAPYAGSRQSPSQRFQANRLSWHTNT